MEKKKKIVLIEDDKPVREGIEILLEKMGFDTIPAKDGEEGLSLIRKHLPDLIISDIMMPKLSGILLKKAIEEDEELAVIPFIFLTAKADIRDIRKGMELGADDYIVKPFDSNDLINAINVRLKKNSLHSHTSTITKEEKLDEKDSIFVDVENKPQFIKISEIVAITAQGNYSNLYLDGNKILIIRKSLNDWQNLLNQKIFKRIHRSAIININKVEKINKWSSGTYLIKMIGIENTFNVSQRYAVKFRKELP